MPFLMMFFCLLFLRISSLSSFALLPFPSLFLFSHICISPFFFHLSLSSFILYLSYPFPLPFLSLPLSSLKPIPALSSSLSFSLPLYFHSLTFISFLHSLIIPSCSFLHVFGPPSLLLPFSSSLLSHALTKALTSPFLLLPSLSPVNPYPSCLFPSFSRHPFPLLSYLPSPSSLLPYPPSSPLPPHPPSPPQLTRTNLIRLMSVTQLIPRHKNLHV